MKQNEVTPEPAPVTRLHRLMQSSRRFGGGGNTGGQGGLLFLDSTLPVGGLCSLVSVPAQSKLSKERFLMTNIGVSVQVVVLVNDGVREFFTKVSPRQGLCAGNWHRITGENPSI